MVFLENHNEKCYIYLKSILPGGHQIRKVGLTSYTVSQYGLLCLTLRPNWKVEKGIMLSSGGFEFQNVKVGKFQFKDLKNCSSSIFI